MAAKPTSSKMDNTVGERRLRQIYDWLDNGNNKRALQEADKVLKKQPDFLCVKVLKALALLRLGQEEKCHVLLESVRKEVPVDDQTLQAMTICYRETQQPKKICEMYDAAAKKDPTNEEILTHLFMAYVRMGDYKKQQRTALLLYQLKPKNPYYFWAVMSVVMESYHLDEKTAQTVSLPLAEIMVKKFIKEGKIEAEQEIQLYLMILEKQGKLQEALEVVNGPLGERLVSYITVPQKKASLLVELKLWKDSVILCKHLLKDSLDQWVSYKNYLTSALNLSDEQEDQSTASDEDTLWVRADSSIVQIKEFLDLIMQNLKKKGNKLRGPFIAWLELYKLVNDRGQDAEQSVGSLVDLLVQYFRLFGDRSCCPSDVKAYLPLLSNQTKTDLIRSISQVVGLEDGELPDSVNRMQQHISTLLLSRFLGYHENLSSDDKLHLVCCLLRYFQHGMQFNKDPLPTDFLHNDPYVTLMAHLLLDEWAATQNSARLLDVLLLLEHALLMSPSNFHFKLLLVKCYQLLGAGAAAHDVYKTLDIKHMQLDSLGYIHCGAVQATGQFSVASRLYDVTLRFFTVNYKDSFDYLSFTYKFGSFVKIQEFVEFRERLSNSMHYALVTVERMLLDILHCTEHALLLRIIGQMEIQVDKDKVDWKRLADNRDMNAYVCWDPPERQISSELVKQTWDADVSFVRLRMILLRGLATAAELCNSGASFSQQTSNNHPNHLSDGTLNGNDSQSSPLSTLETIITELQTTFSSIHVDAPPSIASKVLGSPLPSRLYDYIDSNSVSLQVELFSFLVCLVRCKEKEENTKAYTEASQNAISILQQNVGSAISEVIESKWESLVTRRALFERCVNAVEMVCLAALVCGVSRNLIQPNQQSSNKKGRKKIESRHPQCPKVVEVHNKFVTDVRSVATQLSLSLESLQPRLSLQSQVPVIKPSESKCSVAVLDPSASCGSQDISALSTGMAQLVLNYENRKHKDKGYSVDISAKLSESYEDSLREIRTLLEQKLTSLDCAKL